MVDPGSAWILVQLTHNASELNYTTCPLNCISSALHGPFVVWCAGINVHVQSQWCVPVLFGLISNFQVIVGLKSSFMVSGKTIVTPSTETVFNARHICLYVTVLSVVWNFHMSQKLVTTTTLAPTECSVCHCTRRTTYNMFLFLSFTSTTPSTKGYTKHRQERIFNPWNRCLFRVASNKLNWNHRIICIKDVYTFGEGPRRPSTNTIPRLLFVSKYRISMLVLFSHHYDTAWPYTIIERFRRRLGLG